MSEERKGGEALSQGAPVEPNVLEPVVEGGVDGVSVEAVDPPERVPGEPQTLRRRGERLAEIFENMREAGDPEDQLTEFEENFRRDLVEEETRAREAIDALREEAAALANSNQRAIQELNNRRQTILRLQELEQTQRKTLEQAEARLKLAHAALIKLGEKGGNAEEVEAAMAAINPDAAAEMIAARHALREPKPVEPEPELTTRMAKAAIVEAPAEPTQAMEPVGGGEAEPRGEKTVPFDPRTEFGKPDGKYDQAAAVQGYLGWMEQQPHVAGTGSQPSDSTSRDWPQQ